MQGTPEHAALRRPQEGAIGRVGKPPGLFERSEAMVRGMIGFAYGPVFAPLVFASEFLGHQGTIPERTEIGKSRVAQYFEISRSLVIDVAVNATHYSDRREVPREEGGLRAHGYS
ncbi:MAG: hypothetical protein OXR66_03045 [Candidatus Woesearchaeota archaeon]|nr:hypothetical protein [Candidatus Woesearchaeota archaeon]